MKFRLLSLMIATVTVAGLAAACGSTTTTNTNSNMSRANVTNLGTNNANVGAVVVNSNATNSNSNRWNANITRDEYEKNKADYEKEKGSSTIGSGANDMWLWVKTRASLAGVDDLRDSTINVDVVNDAVTLRGTVGSAAHKARAEQVAKAIDGVKSVKNELQVSAADSATNMSGNSNTNRR